MANLTSIVSNPYIWSQSLICMIGPQHHQHTSMKALRIIQQAT